MTDDSATPNSSPPDERSITQEEKAPSQNTFDLEKARAYLRSCSERRSARLTFEEQCAIFAFAYGGMPNRFLARAFNVSGACVAKITGCLPSDPNPTRLEYQKDQNADIEMPRSIPHDHNGRRNPNRKLRYQRVAREFEHLGEDEFTRRYLNIDLWRMVRATRREMLAAKANKSQNSA